MTTGDLVRECSGFGEYHEQRHQVGRCLVCSGDQQRPLPDAGKVWANSTLSGLVLEFTELFASGLISALWNFQKFPWTPNHGSEQSDRQEGPVAG